MLLLRIAIFDTYFAEFGGVVRLTYVILTRISQSNDVRNIAMYASLSQGCVPLPMAAATIVARYLFNDSGCDYKQCHLFLFTRVMWELSVPVQTSGRWDGGMFD